MDVYGFAHEDLFAARKAIEGALSICFEEAEESTAPRRMLLSLAVSRWFVCADPS